MLLNPWDVLLALIVFLIGGLLLVKTRRIFEITVARIFAIYLWHTIFCFAYIGYVATNGGDALFYFESSNLDSASFAPGTAAVIWTVWWLVNGFGFSLLSAFLFFNVVGVVGLLAFDSVLNKTTATCENRAIKLFASCIVFFPSLSFWSSAIGKDSVAFAATGVMLWSLTFFPGRVFAGIGAVFVMALVRPHIAALMILALGFVFIFSPSIDFKFRISALCAMGLAVAIFLPFVIEYVGLSSSANVEDVAEYLESRQGYNMEGGGGVDLSSMSLPMQMFSYMFRPFVWEAESSFVFFAACENLVLMMFFVFGCLRMNFGEGLRKSSIFQYSIIYSSLVLILLATTTANLGISSRQKWMLMPMVIFLSISWLDRARHKISHKRS